MLDKNVFAGFFALLFMSDSYLETLMTDIFKKLSAVICDKYYLVQSYKHYKICRKIGQVSVEYLLL